MSGTQQVLNAMATHERLLLSKGVTRSGLSFSPKIALTAEGRVDYRGVRPVKKL